MKRQKRVLSPAFIVGADAKIAPYCVTNLAKASHYRRFVPCLEQF